MNTDIQKELESIGICLVSDRRLFVPLRQIIELSKCTTDKETFVKSIYAADQANTQMKATFSI
ncbi:hypothetical protein [Vibrio astriarenae]|uniref:hypothetical protein n=1 Tax=Vibrio astriarenae TaxID=1481923 RepID=UPI0037357577